MQLFMSINSIDAVANIAVLPGDAAWYSTQISGAVYRVRRICLVRSSAESRKRAAIK